MAPSQPEHQLLKTLLEPLLEDFQYWFSRSRSLLETERITFLSEEEQNQLLEKITSSQQEVSTAQMLFQATEGQIGIDTATLVPWHKIVAQCWHVSMRWNALKQKQQNNESQPS